MSGHSFAFTMKLKSSTIYFDFALVTIEMDAKTFFVDDSYIALVVKDGPVF